MTRISRERESKGCRSAANVKILVCYHKKDKLFKNDVLVPIHAGRKIAFEKSKDGSISKKDYDWLLENTIGDDMGDNVSELNREINEWSAIYWAWKNYDKLGNPEYIGLCHYRRLFDFRGLIETKGFSILDKLGNSQKTLGKLLKKYDFIYREGFKITDKSQHTFEGYQPMVNLSSEYHPILFEQYQKFKREQKFYCNNIFLMKKEDFFNMCEEIFPVIFDFIEKPNDEVMKPFLSWITNNCIKDHQKIFIERTKENNGRYPRLTSYMAEYLSCFYFMYLRDKYGSRAAERSVVDPNEHKSNLLVRKIFSVKNDYSNGVKRKVVTVCGIKCSFETEKTGFKKIYKRRFSKNFSIEDKKYILKTMFKRALKYELDLENPKTFNEKIQWLKLYYKNPLLTKCSDKYKVREYIEEKIGREYLIKMLGVYDKPDDIDFDNLPDKFVIKVNWGSGQNIIVKDKSKLNIKEAKEKLANWLKPEFNHYYYAFEWCYKDIEPKIIVEEYIEQLDKDLFDYKFICYNGKVKNLFVVSDRFNNKYFDWYDLDWNRLPFERLYHNSPNGIKKPENLSKMVELAEILAKDFPFARVDFYSIENKIYFGEITFYPGSGLEFFNPLEWDYKLGDMMQLPIRK